MKRLLRPILIAAPFLIASLFYARFSGPRVANPKAGSLEFAHEIPLVFLVAGGPPTKLGHVFEVSNPSSHEPMTCKVQAKSCTCLATMLGSQTVPPSGIGRIGLSAYVPCSTGDHQWQAGFTTGLVTHPELSLTLRVATFARLAVTPEDFPRLEMLPGGTKRLSFDVVLCRSDGESDLEEPTISVGKHVAVRRTARRDTRVRDGVYKTTFEYEATLRCPKSIAPTDHLPVFDERLVVSAGRNGTVSRSIFWNIGSTIQCNPSCMVLNASSPQRRKLLMRLGAAQAFALVDVEDPHGHLVLGAKLNETSRQHVIRCNIGQVSEHSAGLRSGPVRMLRGVLVIKTTHSRQPEIHVPYYILLAARKTVTGGRVAE